MLAVGQYQ
ncbi:Protein of unknown function [Lactobacillus acidophilus DSM 20079 = JCM 1132 = NBRC 13951 = CIP 76.13]|nr:Protein of unknown function [Lactobacillus acidophilus DSM 20079 = JCM 1132 = NBRC 13951 = CIP 76.13]